MSHVLAARSLVLASVAALALIPAARANEAGELGIRIVVLPSERAQGELLATWEEALGRVSTTPGLRPAASDRSPASAPLPTPAAPPTPQIGKRPRTELFATFSSSSSPSLKASSSPLGPDPWSTANDDDWAGYEARDRRAGETLEASVHRLSWPDIEGGSEPLVSSVARTPEGKRSGLGLLWRF